MKNSQIQSFSESSMILYQTKFQCMSMNQKYAITNIDKNIIKCCKGYQADQFCINQKCKINPFTCGQSKCKCRQPHQLCDNKNLDGIFQIIQKKIYSKQTISQTKRYIDDFIDDQMAKLSEFRNQMFKIMNQNLKYSLLSHQQLGFYKIFLIQQNYQRLNSKDLFRLCQKINTANPNKINLLKEQLKRFQSQIIQNINLSIKQIITLMNVTKSQMKNQIVQAQIDLQNLRISDEIDDSDNTNPDQYQFNVQNRNKLFKFDPNWGNQRRLIQQYSG